MAANPLGYVPVFDFGAPRIISGRAREAVSGGQFVFVSGGADTVGSGANSFVTSDLKWALPGSGQNFAGVAIANAGSNELVGVAIDGVIIARADGTVTENSTQVVRGAHAVLDGTTAGHVVGRALSTATSGNFCLFKIGV